MVWLPDGEKTLIICLAVSTEYRRVTDGRTDRRTDRDGRTETDGQTSFHGIVRAICIRVAR